MRDDGDPEGFSDLIRRAAGGDRRAFDRLVVVKRERVVRTAYQVTGDLEDARDVAQGALVKAYSKLASFDPRYRFFSWIYRIVVNEALNTRSRRRPAAPLLLDLPTDGADVEDAVASRERSDSIQAALLRLSSDDREVIVLRHFAELSYAEIGETLGVPEKTIKSRLHEARQRLGRILEPENLQ